MILAYFIISFHNDRLEMISPPITAQERKLLSLCFRVSDTKPNKLANNNGDDVVSYHTCAIQAHLSL